MEGENIDSIAKPTFVVPRFDFSRIAFFASHGGSSMRGIVAACGSRIDAAPVLVVSNNPNSPALAFAREQGIFNEALNVKIRGSQESVNARILELLIEKRVDLIVLSGYMKLLGSDIVRRYAGRIFNIHPALLPKYGGKGMYGMHVHRAVIAAGETETGITIHEVNARYDEGSIIAQKRIAILPGETAEALAERVKLQEPPFLVETLARVQGRE